MRYETVLFDADGTLLDFHRGEAEALCDALRASGVEPNGALVSAYSEINDGMWKLLERGEIKRSELRTRRFEIFCSRFSIPADPRRVADDYVEFLSEKGYLIDGAQELCARLYKDCSLYIVTNGIGKIQRGRLSRLPLHKYFKDVFISEEIGYDKPDVRYFEEAARRIGGIDKSKTLIVGDSLTSDMAGGIAYGIDTCLYSPRKKEIPSDMRITHIAQSYDSIYRFITGDSE